MACCCKYLPYPLYPKVLKLTWTIAGSSGECKSDLNHKRVLYSTKAAIASPLQSERHGQFLSFGLNAVTYWDTQIPNAATRNSLRAGLPGTA